MSKRIEWIDIARFVVIFTMVWAHVGIPSALDAYIHVFHMPIFFLISGYFYNHEKYTSLGSVIKKRGKVLIIPYFAFGILLYLFWSILYLGLGMGEEIVPIGTFLFSLLWANTTVIPYSAVQWFITCLFLTEVLFYIIHKFSKSNNQLIFYLIASGLIGYIYPLLTDFRLPWGLDVAFTALVFYGSGYLIKKYQAENKTNLLVEPKIRYMILIVAATVLPIYFNGYVNMRVMKYGNIFLFYINAFATIYLVLLICKFLDSFKEVKRTNFYDSAIYLGQNTIIILLTHRIFDRSFKLILEPILNDASSIVDSAIYLILTIIIMVIMIPVSKIINKHFYFLLGRDKTELKAQVSKT